MRQANRRRYHYIYKTTCKVTDKYYLGMHSTDDLDDGYMGSGKRLGYSIRKYGKENHVVEILEHYFTREWLREREAELVCAEKLTDPLCMNLKVGGEGGFDHIIISIEEQRRRGTEGGLNWWKTIKCVPEKLQEYKNKSIASFNKMREMGLSGSFTKGSEHQLMVSAASQTQIAKDKRIKTFDEIKHQQGNNNSQYGTCWIHSLSVSKSIKINKDDLDIYLTNGWVLGRKMKF